jgi:hypothetical protein
VVSQSLSSLALLTLRQLRRVASDLGVALYSRKSKEELLDAISHKQEFSTGGRTRLETAISLAQIESDLGEAPLPLPETRVVFLPRDPQWAYVFWEISEASRKVAESAGARQLCLRVSDVTGLQDGSSHPHTLQEVVVESNATEWYLPVPLSDRDYRVELGYRQLDGGWFSLAFSSVARVPAMHPSEQILDQFVPFSLDAEPTTLPAPAESADNSLHERLYQTATIRWRRLGRGSEGFMEAEDSDARGVHHNASGVSRWASGRSESGVGGVAPRQRAFWLVADAELIVYGATDPSATLSIGEETVPLTADGTFRVQVPFRDGHQLYPIKAVAADGEQSRNITLAFERTTPEDNSNTPEQAQSEWF